MNIKINSIEDVEKFAFLLINEGLSIHPDTDFHDYINAKTGSPTYTKKEAELRNKIMDNCFEVCEREGEDIYGIMLDVYLKNSGLEKINGVED